MAIQLPLSLAASAIIVSLAVSGNLPADLANLGLSAAALVMGGKSIALRFLFYAAFCKFFYSDAIMIEVEFDWFTLTMLVFAITDLAFLFVNRDSIMKWSLLFGVLFWCFFGVISILGLTFDLLYNVGNMVLPLVIMGYLCYECNHTISVHGSDSDSNIDC
jgi:hypothetical protein